MAAALSGTRVAVVGLGRMGTAVAERLQAAGGPLAVFNRTPGPELPLVAAGAARLDSAAAALAEADVCLTSLADDAAVAAAVRGPDGVLAGARPGTTLVELSTISVAESRAVAEAAAERGVAYLRAPVSGNPSAVRGASAAILVSGPADAAESLRPLLEAVAPAVRYVGEDEEARVLKLVLGVMVAGTAALLAEALALGEAAGVERPALLEAIGASVIGSRFVAYKTGPLLRDDFAPTFTTALAVKDVELVLELAEAAGAAAPLTEELRELYESAAEHGYADHDFVSLLLELKDRSTGVGAPAKGR